MARSGSSSYVRTCRRVRARPPDPGEDLCPRPGGPGGGHVRDQVPKRSAWMTTPSAPSGDRPGPRGARSATASTGRPTARSACRARCVPGRRGEQVQALERRADRGCGPHPLGGQPHDARHTEVASEGVEDAGLRTDEVGSVPASDRDGARHADARVDDRDVDGPPREGGRHVAEQEGGLPDPMGGEVVGKLRRSPAPPRRTAGGCPSSGRSRPTRCRSSA